MTIHLPARSAWPAIAFLVAGAILFLCRQREASIASYVFAVVAGIGARLNTHYLLWQAQKQRARVAALGGRR